MEPILSFKNRLYVKPSLAQHKYFILYFAICFLPPYLFASYVLIINELLYGLIAYFILIFVTIIILRIIRSRQLRKINGENDFLLEIYPEYLLQKYTLKKNQKSRSEVKNFFTTLKRINLSLNKIEFIYPEGKLICVSTEELTKEEIKKLTSNEVLGEKVELIGKLRTEP